MAERDPPPPLDREADAEPLRLPRRTTPTWDIELLISGASVFALFQLSAAIDDWIVWIEPRIGVPWETFLAMMNIYGNGAVVTLAMTFAVHLGLRARWIALVGMNSVFPGGVRWERIKGGPLQVAVARRRTSDLDTTIERADNLSTIVFALGVALAFSILMPAVTVAVLYGISVAVGTLLGDQQLYLDVFIGLSIVLFAPFFFATGIDRLAGARLDPQRGLGRAIERLIDLYARIGLGRHSNHLLTLLGSNVGERRATAIAMAAMLVVFGIAAAGPMLRASGNQVADWHWIPSDRHGSPRDVLGMHYADLRAEGDPLTTPYLPSMVSRGRWLRLVIPYDPERHNEAIGRQCATLSPHEAKAAAEEFTRRARLLDCVAELHPIQLDGRALASQEYSLYRGQDGLRGFMTMIEVAALEPGRHVLQVGRPAVARDQRRDEPVEPYRIPFWR